METEASIRRVPEEEHVDPKESFPESPTLKDLRVSTLQPGFVEDFQGEWKKVMDEVDRKALRETASFSGAKEGGHVGESLRWHFEIAKSRAKLSQIRQQAIPAFFQSIRWAERTLPFLDLSPLRAKVAEVSQEIEELLGRSETRRSFLQKRKQHFFLAEWRRPVLELEALDVKAQAFFEREAEGYFAPLLRQVDEDLQDFFSEYARLFKREGDPSVIKQTTDRLETLKHSRNFVHFLFTFLLEHRSEMRRIMGSNLKSGKIEISLDIFEHFLESKQGLDEVELMTTIFHEFIHAISLHDAAGEIQFIGEFLFPRYRQTESKEEKPEKHLLELVTELIALKLAAKYYTPDAPLRLTHAGKQKEGGYVRTVQAFREVETKFPKQTERLFFHLCNALFFGLTLPLRTFLEQNRGLSAELQFICDGVAQRVFSKEEFLENVEQVRRKQRDLREIFEQLDLIGELQEDLTEIPSGERGLLQSFLLQERLELYKRMIPPRFEPKDRIFYQDASWIVVSFDAVKQSYVLAPSETAEGQTVSRWEVEVAQSASSVPIRPGDRFFATGKDGRENDTLFRVEERGGDGKVRIVEEAREVGQTSEELDTFSFENPIESVWEADAVREKIFVLLGEGAITWRQAEKINEGHPFP
ncbi:MAG TPA: hypothetical protein VJB99_02900 [Patescibacteria group bacterium]|nr:hypothetical protein [Patescibacteria group bacterium]